MDRKTAKEEIDQVLRESNKSEIGEIFHKMIDIIYNVKDDLEFTMEDQLNSHEQLGHEE